MKILIAIAILLSTYEIFADAHVFKTPRELFYKPHHNPHSRQKLHHHRQPHNRQHYDTYVNEITVDDLADVLLSLPEPLGTQAYRTFLSLREFLPADTTAHKFFTSIPQAIRKKSSYQIPELRPIPQVQSTVNPNFMVPPAGYHMMPLPLHPMFSSPSYNYATHVPRRHTKLIQVPLHTFDAQISAITHGSEPAQNSDDDSDNEKDNDFDSDDTLEDLLDLISADSDDEYYTVDDDYKIIAEPEDGEAAEEKSSNVLNEKTPKVNEKNSKNQEKSSKLEQSFPAKKQPSPAEERIAEKVVAPNDDPKLQKKEISPSKELIEQENPQPEESLQNPPVTENPDKNGKKKKVPVKNDRIITMGLKTESAEKQEQPRAVAPSPVLETEQENQLFGEVTKPIKTKRGRKRKLNGQLND